MKSGHLKRLFGVWIFLVVLQDVVQRANTEECVDTIDTVTCQQAAAAGQCTSQYPVVLANCKRTCNQCPTTPPPTPDITTAQATSGSPTSATKPPKSPSTTPTTHARTTQLLTCSNSTSNITTTSNAGSIPKSNDLFSINLVFVWLALTWLFRHR
ncbi:cell wall integrity and stress response component 4 [Nematostella vectensis]|uniref:cell wall integrity and stress response component 4 n=1 Tax=Nematostella vectensis TaxID=45351 RepID=UPI00207701D5|nr:cell wall integrity and stress response component 4 [Nematostella vectensis]